MKSNKKDITCLIIVILILLAIFTGIVLSANPYSGGGNRGVSWNRGGIEMTEGIGLTVYLCNASYNVQAGESIHYHYDSDYLESLIVEC